jgi:hypothetical protein
MTEYGLESGGTRVGQVVFFDTVGTGMLVNSAQFQVGQTGGLLGASSPPQGIVLYQYVPLSPGWLTVSLDIAAYSGSRNGDAGTFQLLLDGNVMATEAMGFIDFHATTRSSLYYEGAITGGTHQIAVDIRRAGSFAPDTPYEFLANFQVTVVPEPPVAQLVVVGGCLVLLFRCIRTPMTGF